MTALAPEADAALPSRGTDGRFGFAFLSVLVLALIARSPFLFGFAPDDDEFYTLRNAIEFAEEPTPAAVRAYPLTFLAARVGLELFGWHVAALRWFPMLLGIAAVWLLLRRGSTLVGPCAAFVAAACLALWPWHQYFSGLARYYAPLFFAGVGIIAATWNLLQRPSLTRTVTLGAWVAFGVLVHPSAVFALGGLGALVFDPRLRGRAGWQWLFWSVVAFGVIVIAMRVTGAWHNIERVLTQEGGDGADAIQLIFNVGFNVTPLLIALGVVGFFRIRRENRALAGFLAAAGVLPVLLLAALAAAGFGVQGRYAMAGLPALLWLAGASAAGLLELASDSMRKAVIAAASALSFVPGLVSNWIDGDRQPIERAAQSVQERMDAETWVYAESHGLLSLELFGFERERPAGVGEPPAPRALAECPPTSSELASIDSDGGRAIFVVRSHDLAARGGDAGAFAEWLRASARIVDRFGARRFDYHRNELVLLERPARTELPR